MLLFSFFFVCLCKCSNFWQGPPHSNLANGVFIITTIYFHEFFGVEVAASVAQRGVVLFVKLKGGVQFSIWVNPHSALFACVFLCSLFNPQLFIGKSFLELV